MTESQPHPDRPRARAPRAEAPLPPAVDDRREPAVPARPDGTGDVEPTILGFPLESPEDEGTGRLPERPVADAPPDTGEGGAAAGGEQQSVALAERLPEEPASPGRLVVLRRPEPVGAVALLLAGLAANACLWLPWGQGLDTTGLALAWRGVDALASGSGELSRSGLWQPLAVVLGGAVLFFLGLLLFRRARTHRVVGVLALLVSVAPATGVLVLLADAGWDPARLAVGTWCAVAVPVLGLLGALKAMLTAPRVTIRPR
ncbi:hypothetical protein [Geodermatophilus sabuli]|uniref:Uncharacterized protein n=1 Tax=Geodermatophilus sabuli TaxID=1564158 RepID=A0A285EJI7_9ACTN|nr:hypothetical protein [Geodermatophilus sabuli]MBB3083789.1 hypothetical protein [Geodermatophilus sabuli]SNX99302.1 hypothetical protein SAMN06893097_1179 [Geodermatophilus sabuli]